MSPSIPAVPVDANNFILPPASDPDATWAFLKDGIDDIMTKSQTVADVSYPKYMSLYTAVFNHCMCLREPPASRTRANLMGADLYDNLVRYLIDHLKNITSESDRLQDEDLLRYYTAEWDRYTTSTKYLGRLFTFLSCHWVKRERNEGRKAVYPIYTLALVQWKASFLPNAQNKLTDAILQMIECERNGETIEEGLVKKVVDTLVLLGVDQEDVSKVSLDVYKKYLEVPFLDATEEYYERESYAFLAANSLSNYLKKVEERLKEEENRVDLYLNPETRGELVSMCEDVLIRQHSRLMLESFQSLLDSGRDEDLQRMYSLLSRIPDGLEPLRRKFEEHVRKACLAIVSKLSGDKSKGAGSLDKQACADALSEIRRKYSETVARSFKGDASFVASLDSTYDEVAQR